MHRDGTVGGIQTLDMIDALGVAGVNTAIICRAMGLDLARLQEGGRVPSRSLLDLMAAAERQTGDPRIGLRAGQRAVSHDPLAYFLLSCASLEEGARKAAGFAKLMVSTLRMTVASPGDATTIAFELNDDALATSRHFVDYMLMTILRALRSATDEPLAPRAVHVEFADPGDGAERQVFECPVHFGRHETLFVFDRRDFARAPRVANRLVAAQIEKLSAGMLAELGAAVGLRVRVAQATRLLLANGLRPERARVARRLGMSDRTLQRGLEREDTTFKHERDAIVREVVLALLSDRSLKIEAIALSAGFADAGAFVKAFKRWTGDTPTAHRQRLADRAA